MMKKFMKLIALFCMLSMFTACSELEIVLGEDPTTDYEQQDSGSGYESQDYVSSLKNVPEYTDEPYVVLNNNQPEFVTADYTVESYEYFSELDIYGRCGVVMANIGRDLMPTQERGSISHVKPSGWKSVKYDNVDGKYLYNRCHLIGFQLTGENANEKNLITGTRYMNVEGMLPFEDMVADYVKETGNHVLYRVTPIYEGENLVASGVQMEAWSVEDDGEGICFNVYVYNAQPGIEIDYATGDSWEAGSNGNSSGEKMTYILNKNNKKFHKENCSSAASMKEENREVYKGTRADLVKQGYAPCGTCSP